MIQLFRFLLQYSTQIRAFRRKALLGAITGAIGGLAGASFLALFSAALSGGHSSTPGLVWGFLGLCLLVLSIRFASDVLMIHLTTEVTFDLRMKLSRQILSAPLRRLEENGSSQVLAILTDDVYTLTEMLGAIPLFCMQIAVVAGCLAYLAWVSWVVFFIVVVFIAFGIVTYQLPLKKGIRHQIIARQNWDGVFRNFRALVEGNKELKLHCPRRIVFYETLKASAVALRNTSRVWMIVFSAANNWGQILVFLLIGLIIFGLPNLFSIDFGSLTGCSLTILYMVTPLTVLLNMLPILGRASVAIGRMQQLGESLGPEPGQQDGMAVQPNFFWQRLELAGASMTYNSGHDKSSFTLGPLNLSFAPKELTFVTGGNGSGKTTFVKLLTGLYRPEHGEIRIDGSVVTDDNRDDYRQHFSAIYSDYYLFDRLFGMQGDGIDERARDYLARLQLDHKVQIRDGVFSTTDLSQGQRRRLALLTAYLEDRPIYIFDEWAADQDPSFKDIFYHHLLPELRGHGKTVIVVTHDDRYFSIADRIIRLDYGQVIYDRRNKSPELNVADACAISSP